jgi:hypothetical protein
LRRAASTIANPVLAETAKLNFAYFRGFPGVRETGVFRTANALGMTIVLALPPSPDFGRDFRTDRLQGLSATFR